MDSGSEIFTHVQPVDSPTFERSVTLGVFVFLSNTTDLTGSFMTHAPDTCVPSTVYRRSQSSLGGQMGVRNPFPSPGTYGTIPNLGGRFFTVPWVFVSLRSV